MSGHPVYVLLVKGASIWLKNRVTGKLALNEALANSDSDTIQHFSMGLSRRIHIEGDEFTNTLMQVAVQKNYVEIMRFILRYLPRTTINNPKPPHFILLEGSIGAVRVFIEYFDVDMEFQKDTQGRVRSSREIILQKYPQLETELPTPSPSELHTKPETNQQKLLSSFKDRKYHVFNNLIKCPDIDVDFFYGDPDNGTLLDLACQSHGNQAYIYVLLLNGASIWLKNQVTGKLALNEALANSDPNTIQQLGMALRQRIRIEGDKFTNTLMHAAVEKNDVEITRFIVSCLPRTTTNHPKPPHFILLEGNIEAVRVFIEYLDVDMEFQKDTQGRVRSCREIILQKYPQLETELPTPSPSKLHKILFSYLENGVPELFVRRIEEIDTKILNDGLQEDTKLTYFHVACERNYIDVVDALVKKNVQLNKVVEYFNKFAEKVTPIMLAAFKGHYKILKKLSNIPVVELQTVGGSGSVWHLALHGMQFLQDRNCSTDGHFMILESLSELSDRLNVEHQDKRNRTALHYALKFNNEFAIKLLLRAGAKLYVTDQSILTSISASIIERYFDDCIRSSKESICTRDDESKPLIFHYQIFTQLDLYSIVTKIKGNFFARFESVTEMRKLYKHPLTKSLLYLKWRLVRKYYYFNLTSCLLFCLTLSAYIFQIQHRQLSSISLYVSTLLLYIVLILRELCQFSISIRRYLGISENWFEVMMIVVVGFLFADETNTHLAAISILTSWIAFILLLGKQPSLSIYIEMFKTVALNFVKFLLLYSILIASFAYSFFILFRNKPSGQESSQNRTNVNCTKDDSVKFWQDMQMSFFKSIIMMTGEFDAVNLPLGSNFSFDHAFFILFVFLVAMVLYNLLNGLAVSDTRAIMEDAEIVALISRAKLISQIEHLAISNPFHHAFNYCRITKQLERLYIFLRSILFGDEIFIDETRQVYVFQTENNRIEIDYRNFGKMPFTIVKRAEEILEKRKRTKLTKKENQNALTENVTKNNSREHQFVDELVHQFSEQISDLKLEIDAKIATRDEKLLQNVDMRFEKINKLLESVLQEVNLLKNND
ncbi:transient receptor potential cation channel protein painless-like [Planococcus citri]|uniref:transient receptor potential cation channel protein painless-like n=1 Tax=Planococcus citri TaxID=170843 RepID=UPI0031F79E6B